MLSLKSTAYLFKILIVTLLVVACSGNNEPRLTALTENTIILAFGDSLTYGTGANSATESYPAMLAELTKRTVHNRGIPGEISQYGLERLADVLHELKPDLVILCHGGNDLIRKLDHQQLKSNLEQMILLIKNSGSDVILVGIPNFNFGFNVPDLYSELAIKYQIPAELSILEKIERSPSLKSDQVHPNAAGYSLLAKTIMQLLQDSGAL